MKIFILGLIFAISPLLTLAHNPLSAKYHFDIGEHASLLTINLSQDGVNHVLLKRNTKQELEALSQKQFEELIVDYIKSNFILSIDNQEIKLEKGGIKLGSHQTDLKFVLPAFSQKVEKIAIQIPAFKENDNHQTIFSYNLKGTTDHVILSSNNNYQSTIRVTRSAHSRTWIWLVLIGFAGLISLILLKLNFWSSEVKLFGRNQKAAL